MLLPHTIELNINEQEYMQLTEIEKFDDESGFKATLNFRAGSFCLIDYPFYFDSLNAFHDELTRMNKDLKGSANLQLPWERNHIGITINERGHLWIYAKFEQFDGSNKNASFGFSADQTYLPSIIGSIRQALNAA